MQYPLGRILAGKGCQGRIFSPAAAQRNRQACARTGSRIQAALSQVMKRHDVRHRRQQRKLLPSDDDEWLGDTMSDEELKAELERLRSENAALKKVGSSSIRMKVSEKGAVSIYGMGRFPVTLYKEQWLKLLDMADEIRAFIAANEAQLKTKA
jgi:hypothetical protein